MASKRRGGFGPPELRGTLGTLLRTTTGVVRDALERGAREGRARLDDVRAGRRRQDALAELGEIVLDLIRRGEIDLDELPEARALVQQLEEMDDAGGGEPEPPRPARRSRFDDRGGTHAGDVRAASVRGADGSGGTRRFAAGTDDHSADARSAGPRRPGAQADAPRHAARADDDRFNRRVDDDGTLDERPHHNLDAPRGEARRRPGSDDGTVSSGAALRATRPTTPGRPRESIATTRAMTKPIKGMWRPDVDHPGPDDHPASGNPPSPRRPALAPDPHRKGGISFDDDDLADYMHPDDVPARSPARDPDDHDP